jgi:hypothetical protein
MPLFFCCRCWLASLDRLGELLLLFGYCSSAQAIEDKTTPIALLDGESVIYANSNAFELSLQSPGSVFVTNYRVLFFPNSVCVATA